MVNLCLKVTCNKMKQLGVLFHFRSLGGVAICIGCICKCCKSGTYWPYLPIYWNSFRKITLKGYHATWRVNVILLQLTDKPNAPDNFGVTPIHMAARIGHAEIAKPWPLSSCGCPKFAGCEKVHYINILHICTFLFLNVMRSHIAILLGLKRTRQTFPSPGCQMKWASKCFAQPQDFHFQHFLQKHFSWLLNQYSNHLFLK